MPLAAGSARYPYRRFLPWNLAMAFLRAVGATVLGSLLGGVPFVAKNLDVLLAVVVPVSIAPIIVDQLRMRVRARRTRRDEASEAAQRS